MNVIVQMGMNFYQILVGVQYVNQDFTLPIRMYVLLVLLVLFKVIMDNNIAPIANQDFSRTRQ